MQKEWIRLFSNSEKSIIEETLNSYIRDFDVTDIEVWTNKNHWYAKIRYKFIEE